jgi:excisionase family DNA binding protein
MERHTDQETEGKRGMSRCSDEKTNRDQLMNTAQIAGWLSMSESTIRKWVHYGFIPHIKLGRAVRFSRKDIEAWLHERTETGRATLAPEIQWQ